MDERLKKTLARAVREGGSIVVLTGAGISAESGIPTFRGPEGYWTVGSKEYRPEEMATQYMFRRHPDEVWQWYLYRRGVCRRAAPNPGHEAVADLERLLGDRFLLITQNVDGLHPRAGSSPERTFEIHGNIDRMRCFAECRRAVFSIPEAVPFKSKNEPLGEADRALLRCPDCGGPARPHVLWFDECYDEEYYRYESSIRAASKARVLISVGTSGATNLPVQVGRIVLESGGLLIDVNLEENFFGSMAVQSGGFFCRGPGGEALPRIRRIVEEAL